MNFRKIHLMFFLLLLCAVSPVEADRVTLTGGEEFSGDILEKTDSYIKIITEDGGRKIFFKDDIKDFLDEGEQATVPVAKSNEKQNFEWSQIMLQELARSVVLIKTDNPSAQPEATGFIVDRNGLVITNFHVIVDAKNVNVVLQDGQSFPLEGIVEFDPVKDVCVIKISGQNFPALPIGDSKVLNPGYKVRTIGIAENNYFMAEGLISQFKDDPVGSRITEFKADLGKSLSGAPLFDESAKVVGITTAIGAKDEEHRAVPVNEFQSYIRQGTFRLPLESLSRKPGLAYQLLFQARDNVYAEKWDQVLTLSQQAIELLPSLGFAYFYAGAAQMNLGHMDEAEQMFNEAIQREPNYDAIYMQLGMLYFKEKKYGPAVEEFQSAAKVNPASPQPWNLIGLTYLTQGFIDESAAYFKKSIEIGPNNLDSYQNLGFLFFQTGRCEQAMPLFEKYLSFLPSAQVNNQLGICLARTGDLQGAIEHLETATTLDPKNGEFFSDLCAAYKKDGNTAAAEKACAQANALPAPEKQKPAIVVPANRPAQ